MTAEPAAGQVRDWVVASPHWYVAVRPRAFVGERLSLGECWRLIESANVQLRGWDYPHLDHRLRGQGQDWIQSWVDFMGHRSFWRFFQSGQFVHVFALNEDFYGEESDGRVRQRVTLPPGFVASGYVDFINLLYTTTEIAEFCSRLVQSEAFGSGVQLEIALENVANRLLASVEPMRFWHHFYASTENRFAFSWDGEASELTSESALIARRAASHFYERFGWFDAPQELIVEEQKAFLERRSGSGR
jgi:hypothetical protein